LGEFHCCPDVHETRLMGYTPEKAVP